MGGAGAEVVAGGDEQPAAERRLERREPADLGDAAPAGFGIDFGVLLDGRTVLVEMNDGYSLGSYGLNAVEYSELLEARWAQLANG